MTRSIVVVFFAIVTACAVGANDEDGPGNGTGGWDGTCGEEFCDGFDNDCDGDVDEDACGPCSDGDTKSCYSGLPQTVNVGLCKQGTLSCVNGQYGGECVGEVTPGHELCDNLDNDCDGIVDNNCGAGGAGGEPYGEADSADPGPGDFDFREIRFPEIEDPVTLQVELTWQDLATRPAPYDLTVRLAGMDAPLLQVFSVKDRPFVRIGVQVRPLQQDAVYRIEVTRVGSTVMARVVDAERAAVILDGPVIERDPVADDRVVLVTPVHMPRVEIEAATVSFDSVAP